MEVYPTGWRILPNKYSGATYNLDHCNKYDIEQYPNSPFHAHAPALHHQQPIFTPQPLYRLRTDASADNTMSVSAMYTGYRSAIDFSRNWNSPYEVTPPASLHDNDFDDTAFPVIVSHFEEPLIQPEDARIPLDTLDPRKLHRQFKSCSFTEPVSQYIPDLSLLDQSYDSPPDDRDSFFYTPTVYQDSSVLWDEDDSPPASDPFVTSPVSKHIPDDAEASDKPYAKLIYEALMQAPGHKMMLRDIYEWFMVNTTKPQDSGSTGWQNSIRHNLSMNQAFENDKGNSTATRGHSRKANSVWMLTDQAVKHGVQSTTRYRKPGLAKKGAASRTPAIERQRSGAKGGRATRKCAVRVKKEDHTPGISKSNSAMGAISCFEPCNMDIGEGAARPTPRSQYVQPTPALDTQYQLPATLSACCHGNSTEPPLKFEHDCASEQDFYIYDALFHSCSEPRLEEITKIETA